MDKFLPTSVSDDYIFDLNIVGHLERGLTLILNSSVLCPEISLECRCFIL